MGVLARFSSVVVVAAGLMYQGGRVKGGPRGASCKTVEARGFEPNASRMSCEMQEFDRMQGSSPEKSIDPRAGTRGSASLSLPSPDAKEDAAAAFGGGDKGRGRGRWRREGVVRRGRLAVARGARPLGSKDAPPARWRRAPVVE